MLRLLAGGAYDGGIVPASVLNRYTGFYEFPGTLVAVQHEGLELAVKVAKELPFEIVPKTQTEFGARGIDPRLRFVLDSTDACVALVMRRGRFEGIARRVTDMQAQSEMEALQARIEDQAPDPGHRCIGSSDWRSLSWRGRRG